MSQQSLDALKALYRKGLKRAQEKYKNPFSGKLENLCELQQTLADSAPDLNTFMNALWINNPIYANAFPPPKSVCSGCELQMSGVQFGVSPAGWYFVYGIAGGYAFNFSIFRYEIAPPDVVTEEGIIDRNQAVRWLVSGGYGQVGGNWFSVNSQWTFLNYLQISYSTFSLEGSGKFMPSFTFSSPIPMNFLLKITYQDTQGADHNLVIEMIANSPPNPNVPGTSEIYMGISTMYYSYTSLQTRFIVNGTSYSGKSWIDHQLIGTNLPDTLYEKALLSVLSSLNTAKSKGWLWFSIQDFESDIQYLFHHFFDPTKTFTADVKLGEKIEPLVLVNVYKKGVSYFHPTDVSISAKDTEIVMTETISVNGVNLPKTYRITLPGGKRVILTLACAAPNVYPTAYAPYESPAYLYDENKTNIIGIGLIESNWYFSFPELTSRLLQAAGGNPGDAKQFNAVLDSFNPPKSVYQKILAFFVVLFPLILLIIFVVFVFKGKEKKGVRLAIASLCIVFAIFLIKKC